MIAYCYKFISDYGSAKFIKISYFPELLTEVYCHVLRGPHCNTLLMICISVHPKPEKFSVFADDHGNIYFNWSAVRSASGYTVYWCEHHAHMQQCMVCLVTFFFVSVCSRS